MRSRGTASKPELIADIDATISVIDLAVGLQIYGVFEPFRRGDREQPDEPPRWEVEYVRLGFDYLRDGPVFEACCEFVNDPDNGLLPQKRRYVI